jgi:hypothetical protein
VTITADWSSLNSLNGLVDTADGRRFFFKFHQEEGEEGTVEEYYRAELLQRAGLPVDMPAMMSRKPGHQILLYAFRRDRQLAATCLDIERTGDSDVAGCCGFRRPDRQTGAVYPRRCTRLQRRRAGPRRSTSSSMSPRDLPTRPALPAAACFYLGRAVDLPGVALPWPISRSAGGSTADYADTLAGLFDASLGRLAPDRLAGGAVTAHGDAHNANVWIEERGGDSRLVMFDPAFAGEHVPALLADVKATFHNVFAHPLWLYHPGRAGGSAERRRGADRGRPQLGDAASPRVPDQGRACLAAGRGARRRGLLRRPAARGAWPHLLPGAGHNQRWRWARRDTGRHRHLGPVLRAVAWPAASRGRGTCSRGSGRTAVSPRRRFSRAAAARCRRAVEGRSDATCCPSGHI